MLTVLPASRAWLTIAAISGAITVGLGAFGSHGLRGTVTPEMLQVWRTAVEYQFFHTVSLLACALYPNARRVVVTMWLWLAGVVLFSGSLYALVLTGYRVLGMITPLGGVAFIIGWLALAWSTWQPARHEQ